MNGEIVVGQDDLTLEGPYGLSSAPGTVTISGDNAGRVFKHTGTGTFAINSLTVTEGFAASGGGCIYSKGNVLLSGAAVANCVADNTSGSGTASGGGIFATRNVTLIQSIVTGNHAIAAQGGSGQGGGIYTQIGGLTSKYSTISDNLTYHGKGGGALVSNGNTYIIGSTIDQNQSQNGSGLYLGLNDSVTIIDSTISGNIGNYAALLWADSAKISNSTIAFNHAPLNGERAGIAFNGFSASSSMILHSSIFANDTAGPSNVPSSDLHMAQGILSGQNNLVIMSTGLQPPAGVIEITSDPKLGPLQFNGGRTQTHALRPDSPAIAKGDDVARLDNDQRGQGYPRTTGGGSLVDIGAFQFDSIFVDDFE